MDIKLLVSYTRVIWKLVISVVYVFFAYLFVFEKVDYAVSTKIILVIGLFSSLKNTYIFLFAGSNSASKVLSFFYFVPSFLYSVTFVYALLFGHFL